VSESGESVVLAAVRDDAHERGQHRTGVGRAFFGVAELGDVLVALEGATPEDTRLVQLNDRLDVTRARQVGVQVATCLPPAVTGDVAVTACDDQLLAWNGGELLGGRPLAEMPIASAGPVVLVVKDAGGLGLLDVAGDELAVIDAPNLGATVATRGDRVVLAWLQDGAAHVRTLRCDGIPAPAAVRWSPVNQGPWTNLSAEKPVTQDLRFTTRVLGDPLPPAPFFPGCVKHAAPPLAAHETTVAEYRACVRVGKCAPNVNDEGLGESYPVRGISLAQARAYCAYAGTRLPTDDEWSAAVSAECSSPPKRASCMTSEAGYHMAPVGSFPDDAVDGRFDLFGNAMEWTDSGTVRGSPYCNFEPGLKQNVPLDPRAFPGFRCMARP
jgi:hypothetical protein